MRVLSRRRLAAGLGLLFAVRLAYYAGFGVANGYSLTAVGDALLIEVRQFTLVAVVLYAALCRPRGGGQLVRVLGPYVVAGELPDRDSIETRTLALELASVVLGSLGAAGVLLFAVVPGRYTARHSLAEVLGIRSVFGLGSTGFFLLLLAGMALWGLAWVADGIDVSGSPVSRQTE